MKVFCKRFIVPLLLVFFISGAVIYSTVDIHTLKNLTAFQPWSIALALLCVSLGLTLDGTRLMHLVKISGEHITLGQAVQVVFGNYFLALLTPGATGGAVAQLMFLRHAGVPAGKATVLVIVRTLVSILFLICCMPLIFLHDAGILPGVDNHTLMLVSVIAFVAIALIALAFRANAFDYIVLRLTKRLSAKRSKKLLSFYRDLKTGVHLLASSPKSMVRIFFESGLSLMFIYAIVPCLLLGLGVTAPASRRADSSCSLPIPYRQAPSASSPFAGGSSPSTSRSSSVFTTRSRYLAEILCIARWSSRRMAERTGISQGEIMFLKENFFVRLP